MANAEIWRELTTECVRKGVTLVAISKTKTIKDIEALYTLGQRDFGENYVQELIEKHACLPVDIRWHYVGHLQGNKVRYIAPFVHLIHAVDSFKLLAEINKQAVKNNRTIDILLQIHIANEETKFGLDEPEISQLLDYYLAQKDLPQNVRICGLMGMATNTDDETIIRSEFSMLYSIFNKLAQSVFSGQQYFSVCSMGMSADYKIAVDEGSTMVRIGSLLFGNRS